jgi:hypothetical protein
MANMVLFRLIDRDLQRGIHILGGDPLDQQLARIERLLPFENPGQELGEKVMQWVQDVRKVKDERNRILHATWLFTEESTPGPTMALLVKKGRSRVIEYSVGDLASLAEGIDLLSGAGFALIPELSANARRQVPSEDDEEAGDPLGNE